MDGTRESLLAFRTRINGSHFRSEEFSNFGSLPKCVWTLRSKTRLVRFVFCFCRFTHLKL